jgi:hypothetical protein
MNALKRMLAHGPLTAYPTRRSDQELLLRLAAARFERGRAYTEAEVNDILAAWLDTFCAPYGIDHVSMRRYLVDARLLARDTAGSTYRLAAPAAAADAEPAQVLAQLQRERALRKRTHISKEG